MSELFNSLKTLSEINGITSNEKEVSTYIQNELKEEAKKDFLGSLVYTKGSGAKVLLTAHIDEVGMMVNQITADGFIKFQTVGKLNVVTLINQKVLVTSKKSKFIGVLQASNYAAADLKSLYIDLGFKSAKEAIEAGISVGDMITLYQPLEKLNGSLVTGKALDNRVAVLVLLELLKKKIKTHVEASFAFTTQGEVGLKGSKTTSFMVEPDLGINIEALPASDLPGLDKTGNQLGMGPQIVFYDAGLIAHHGLRNYILDLAREKNIPFQETFIQNETTDAANIALSKRGAASITIGIPVRYNASNNQVADLTDLENTINLLEAIITSLTDEKVKEILY